MPDPTPSLTEIAATVRKHAPGAVPESIDIGDKRLWTFCAAETDMSVLLPDDIARHVLGFAMVMDCRAVRLLCPGGWDAMNETEGTWRTLLDEDHSGDPLLSLYAAWRWARGIE
jgi:hypothetical protein